MTRRRPWAAAAVAAACCGIAAAIAAPSSGDSDYRVDVVFDDSRGLIPGQLVQVAGARVGSIEDVSVTRSYKARVHMRVDRRFAPFRTDARCTIKPQGLIAENYVQCDPGSPDARELRGRGGRAPTVPVERTTQPVSLTDLFEVWNTPTRHRLTVLLSSLGMANAGRGQDVNAVLRRLNPSLALARRTAATLARQRDDLAATVDATGTIARELARRPGDLRRLLRHGARVTTETATHRAALAEGTRELPGLLRESTPALQKLDAVMEAGQPLLDQIGTAAPDVNRLTADIPRLARVARPTLRRLRPVLRRGAATARRTAPLSGLLRTYARTSLPSTRTAEKIFTTLEDRGFNANLLRFFYTSALASARYDGNGHLLPSYLGTSCTTYATSPRPECGAGSGVTSGGPSKDAGEPSRKRASVTPTPPAAEPAPDGPPDVPLLDYLLR
ncbi:MAG TPA: MlaD family protein [Thermoleophilaceae bacterium]|nr:MlaD family protein [Thermoleophilaceae bacterium]